MKKISSIKRFKCLKSEIYKIKDKTKKVGNKNFELNKNIKIRTREIEGNIIGIEFIKSENNNIRYLNIEVEILKELENDNNIYIFDFDNWNNPILMNKNLINANIDNNLFKYYKKGNQYAELIHLTIFNYKKMINSNYFEKLFFSESFLTFLFLDIYNKEFNHKSEFEVEYIIQSIPIDEKIAVKLIFKLDEEEKDNIKLNFRMDYYDNRISRNVLVSKVRDLLKKKMSEKMDFDLDLFGYYILDKENFKIKEIKAEQRIKIDDKLYEREFFIKEELENVKSEEKSKGAKEIIEKDKTSQIEIPKVENLSEKELAEIEKISFKKPKKPIEETFDGIRDWLLPLLRKDDKIIFPKEEFLERIKLFDEAEKLRTFNVIKSAVEHDGYCVKFEEGKTIRGYEVKKIFGEMLGIVLEEEVVEKVEEKEMEMEKEKKLTPQQLRKKKFLERMKEEE